MLVDQEIGADAMIVFVCLECPPPRHFPVIADSESELPSSSSFAKELLEASYLPSATEVPHPIGQLQFRVSHFATAAIRTLTSLSIFVYVLQADPRFVPLLRRD
ncbi:hypothetical protein EDB86DRAFT_3075265 [Lactarius hatsudake]|nr:hypothetical protein EDB86DRAFT_3075265 [Lactarius hatsudake]